jgi:hypothetical protein
MLLLDKIPGELKLYIGGCVQCSSPPATAHYSTCPVLTLSKPRLFTLRRKQQLDDANITHVLSVLRLPLDQDLFRPFKHLVIEVDDVDDENLVQYFVTTNGFIQEGLDSGGGVLVHWLVRLGSSPFPHFAHGLFRRWLVVGHHYFYKIALIWLLPTEQSPDKELHVWDFSAWGSFSKICPKRIFEFM